MNLQQYERTSQGRFETATGAAVFIAIRPGALARVCNALANAEIEHLRVDCVRHCRSHDCADVGKARRALEEL
jgi:hypothetical protein